MVFTQHGCVFALLSVSEATLTACSGSNTATANWNNDAANTCTTGTMNTLTCADVASSAVPACGAAACCFRSCQEASFVVTSCDAGYKLKTGADFDTKKCSAAMALNCGKSLCCDVGTGATCATVSAEAGFCGAGKEYDSDMAAKLCKATGGGACVAEDPTDVHACCKTTVVAPTLQVCSAGIFATAGNCPPGKSYKVAQKDAKCASAKCDKTVTADQTSCCSANAGATCGDASKGATAADFCGTGMEYDKTMSANLCKAPTAGACVVKDPVDVKTCCKKTVVDAKTSTNNTTDTSASNALTAITAVLVTVGLNQ